MKVAGFSLGDGKARWGITHINNFPSLLTGDLLAGGCRKTTGVVM